MSRAAVPDVDVLVAGGGPVGLAAAVEARAAGFSVCVVEPRGAPVDKACGEGLMPGAVAALARLGVDPPGHVLAGIAYRDGRRSAEHRFRAASGRGVRRTALHAALGERARAAGVDVVRGRVADVQQHPGGVRAAGIGARWLLACDGLHSTVRERTDLGAPARAGVRRYGLRRHYRLPPWSDLVEVHWTPEVELYVTPVADDLVGVAVLGPRGSDLDTAVAAVPALAARLRGAAAGPLRGAGPLRQVTRARSSGRVLLVGDAAGYVDALTGEGLRVGLAQARAAVTCLAAHEDPAAVRSAYERAWSVATRDVRLLTTALVRAATSPLRGALVPAAAAAPPLFGAVVERLAR